MMIDDIDLCFVLKRRAVVIVQTIGREGAAGGTSCTAHMRVNEYNIYFLKPYQMLSTIKYYK